MQNLHHSAENLCNKGAKQVLAINAQMFSLEINGCYYTKKKYYYEARVLFFKVYSQLNICAF